MSFRRKQMLMCLGVMMGLLAGANSANAQRVSWGSPTPYDEGTQPSLAQLASGLTLECHKAYGSSKDWYRLGKVNHYFLAWGKGKEFPKGGGYWPSCPITRDGYVVFTYSKTPTKYGSRLFYRVGKLDPAGNKDQDIVWLTDEQQYDTGFHSNTVVNDNGLILDVHESDGNNGLFYQVGHLDDPQNGKYSIVWDTGSGGVQYDDGINPHVGFNDRNEVVEVHQVAANESLLHYRRGTVTRAGIAFGPSYRYDDDAIRPALVLLNNGHLIELQVTEMVEGGYDQVFTRTGTLDETDSSRVRWSELVRLSDPLTENDIHAPAVASNGSNAIADWERVTRANAFLQYSVGVVAP